MLRISPCPNRPNCASSLPGEAGGVEPIPLAAPAEEARELLRRALEGLPRCRVVAEEAGYLKAEARSAVLGFVDDVEVEIEEAGSRAHVRSASRTGYWDLGVNRRRLEELRRAYLELEAGAARAGGEGEGR